jgi:hypothetical protein
MSNDQTPSVVPCDPLDYAQPARKKLWWQIAQVGIYVVLGLIVLSIIFCIVRTGLL